MLPRAKVAGLGRKDIRATVETQLPSYRARTASGRGRRSVARILASYVFTRLLLPDLRAEGVGRVFSKRGTKPARSHSLSYPRRYLHPPQAREADGEGSPRVKNACHGDIACNDSSEPCPTGSPSFIAPA